MVATVLERIGPQRKELGRPALPRLVARRTKRYARRVAWVVFKGAPRPVGVGGLVGMRATYGQAARAFLCAPVLGLGSALSAVFCVTAAQSLAAAWPITYPEGAQLAGLLRVRDGAPLYQDFRQFPWVITPYPPLLYVLGGLMSRGLDLGVLETMIAARGITFAASLAAAGLIYGLARVQGCGRIAALAGALLFLPLPMLDGWGFTIRPDVLGVALSLLALLLALRMPARIWVAAAIAALAFFAKQTMVVAPVAIICWLLFQKRIGTAVRFGAIWVALLAAGLAGLHLATGGLHELNVIISHLNPVNGLDSAVAAFLELPRIGWLPVSLAVGAIALGAVRQRRLGLVGWSWLLSLAFALWTLRGRGADVNYLIEPAALACVLAAGAIDATWRTTERGSRAGWLAAALLAVATAVWSASTWQYWRDAGGLTADRQLPLAEIAAAERVLAEEPTMVLLAGRPLVFSDPLQFSQMASAGRFDPAEVVQRVRRHEFDLIVLRGDARRTRYINGQPKWPEPIRRAIADYYTPAGRSDLFWLYVPARR